MKKFTISVLAAAFIFMGIVPTVYAGAPASTLVTGYVTEKGKSRAGATVVASCGRYFADTDVTAADGAYLIIFPVAECGPGSDVELLAITSNNFGTARGMVYRVSTKLNVAVKNILTLCAN